MFLIFHNNNLSPRLIRLSITYFGTPLTGSIIDRTKNIHDAIVIYCARSKAELFPPI